MKRKPLLFIFTIVALSLGGIATGGVVSSMLEKPIEATYAEGGISYISRSWDGTKIVESEETCTVYDPVNSNQFEWSAGWYVLESNVTFEDDDELITIDGNVNLVLMDGLTLTAKSGIVVNSGNALNIYSQSGGTGALNVTVGEEMGPGSDTAGIGGDEHNDCGTINIYGGNITANGSHGAGIGGGPFGNGGNITIYGGTINATSRQGAGIGGGTYGNGGNITIYGGNITAVSTEDGAGIGGGADASGGNITIHDGVVIAKGNCGAAIGGGSEGAGGTITINGGTVTATNLLNAAGIGGGQVASGGTINITGGTVYATGGAGAAGIGGGDFGNYGGTGGNVTISGGTVYATGGSDSVGIGAGKNSTEHGSLTITETSFGVYGDNDKNPPTTEREKSGSAGYDTVRWKNMFVGIPHEHNWSYSADGATITASCSNPECPVTEGLTLELQAPTGDMHYDGNAKAAALEAGYNAEAFPSPTINYYQGTAEVTSCVNAGTYTAKVTFGTATAVLEFTIAQATPTPEVPTGLVATYGDKLSSVALPSGWAWKVPTDEVGDVGDRTHVAIYTPTDPNYKAVEANVIISVAQATPTPEVPTGLVATYGDKLSSVALPSGWAWKVPTDEVGDVGDRTHVAIYTPTDPNYKAVEANVIITVEQSPDVVVVNEVQTLVENLGTITIEDKQAIEAAREAYEGLTPEQKEMFPAETLALLENSEKAFDTISKINDIGEIDNSEATKKAIEEAKALYDALTDEQKELLDEDYVETLLNSVAVQETIDAINEIGDVIKYDADSKETIAAAREAYEGLTPEQKELFPAETLVLLENSEAVYDVLEKIYNIGDVDYNDASKAKIEGARAAYESLTPEQKALVGENALKALISAENAYAAKEAEAKAGVPSGLTAGIVISAVVLTAGIGLLIYLIMKLRKKDDEGVVKAKSSALFVPFLAVLSAATTGATIALIILLVLALGVIAADVVLFLKLRKKNEKARTAKKAEPLPVRVEEKAEPAQEAVAIAENGEEDGQEAETVTDERGNVFQIRYVRSFEAKLIQAPEETKKYYEELKNEVLSYKKANSRVSWHFDSVNSGRAQVLKFAIRGKTLCLYLALNADDYDDTKYKVEKVESKKFEDVPCLYRIKNDRRLGYAKDLIAAIMGRLGVEKGEEKHEPYADLPYEPNKPLIERGLIKELKVAVSKPQEAVAAAENDEEDGGELETVTDEKGNVFQIRYVRSFTAKLIQAPEETKKYYEKLKNEVLSYKKANSRVSWHFDSVNSGRAQVLKFAIRGKTLCLYLALNADDYAETKYKVEKVESKKFEEVPCLYRIKNDRRLGYAKDLIAVIMGRLGVEKGEEKHESYADLPYEPNKPLIERGLIKELKVAVSKPQEAVVEKKTNADGDEVILTKDGAGNLFEIRFVKSFTAKLSQSEGLVKDYYSILKNYALSYKNVHTRISWHFDSLNLGRAQILKFAIRGKTLCVYFALNAEDYAETKYKVEKVESKKFEDVPCLYRIKNDRRLGYAKDLIDALMAKFAAVKGKESSEDFKIPYETTEALLEKGLVKELKTKVNAKEEEPLRSVEASTVDSLMSDEKAESSIEEDAIHSRREGKKGIINIDTLSENFNDGDTVDLDALIAKKLVSPNTGYVKVLARGVLSKKLIVELDDFSLQAVKMIVLMGGHAKKIK